MKRPLKPSLRNTNFIAVQRQIHGRGLGFRAPPLFLDQSRERPGRGSKNRERAKTFLERPTPTPPPSLFGSLFIRILGNGLVSLRGFVHQTAPSSFQKTVTVFKLKTVQCTAQHKISVKNSEQTTTILYFHISLLHYIKRYL